MDNNWNEIPVNRDWKEPLLRQGKLKSMCTENLDALRKCERREDAISLYKKTIDWALENNYPTLDILREYFSDIVCECNGLFVGRDIDVTASIMQAYVFHDCKGVINVEMDYDGCTIPMIYLANGCDVTLTCRQPLPCGCKPIRVPVYATSDSRVKIDKTPNAMFTIYKLSVKL